MALVLCGCGKPRNLLPDPVIAAHEQVDAAAAAGDQPAMCAAMGNMQTQISQNMQKIPGGLGMFMNSDVMPDLQELITFCNTRKDEAALAELITSWNALSAKIKKVAIK